MGGRDGRTHDGRRTREALERHWALQAIAPERRASAERAASAAWEALLRGNEKPRPLARNDARAIAACVEAWDLAALDRARLLGDEGADPERMRAELRVAAAPLLALLRVLPIAGDSHERLAHALRMATVAAVADDSDTLLRWRQLHPDVMTAEDAATPGWLERCRAEIAEVWLVLFAGAALPDAVEQAFVRLARLRELRREEEPAYFASLTVGAAQQAYLQLGGLHALAECAAVLVLALRRAPREDAAQQIAQLVATARHATLAGSPLDRALPWVQAAALLTVERTATQLSLPGLLA